MHPDSDINLAYNSENLPVMAWIYGGGFRDGTSTRYNGTALVAQSLVIVSSWIALSTLHTVTTHYFLGSTYNICLHELRKSLS